jgi:hypothetical protein
MLLSEEKYVELHPYLKHEVSGLISAPSGIRLDHICSQPLDSNSGCANQECDAVWRYRRKRSFPGPGELFPRIFFDRDMLISDLWSSRSLRSVTALTVQSVRGSRWIRPTRRMSTVNTMISGPIPMTRGLTGITSRWYVSCATSTHSG